ncbi:MAG: extracellular solute-binding protein [Anaerolineae bacterium]|nr:extracellular solute-binding protein [Anaerolineae bacterium]
MFRKSMRSKLLILCAALLLVIQTVPLKAQEPTKLVFWDNLFAVDETGPREDQFIFRALDMFQKENPDIVIERVHQAPDLGTFDQLLRAASVAGNGPDVFNEFAGGSLISFAPFIEPLDSYFTKEEMDQIVGWDAVRNDFKSDGALLGVPYGAGSYFAIYYNKKMMEKGGVDMSKFTPPETWEDLITLAQGIKDHGVQPFAMGEQEGYTGAWVMATLVGGLMGPQAFFDMRARTKPINSPEWVQAYEAYKQLYTLGLVNVDAGSLPSGDGQLKFTQGESAMWIQGGWANKDINNIFGEDAGLFKIPTLKGSVYPGGLAGGPNISLAVMNYSKVKPEAIKFIKFMLRPDVLDLYVSLNQTEPSNHLKADPAVIQNPLLKIQAEQILEGKTIYPFDNIMPGEINSMFYRLNAAVFIGQLSSQEAADQLQAAYDAMK